MSHSHLCSSSSSSTLRQYLSKCIIRVFLQFGVMFSLVFLYAKHLFRRQRIDCKARQSMQSRETHTPRPPAGPAAIACKIDNSRNRESTHEQDDLLPSNEQTENGGGSIQPDTTEENRFNCHDRTFAHEQHTYDRWKVILHLANNLWCTDCEINSFETAEPRQTSHGALDSISQ